MDRETSILPSLKFPQKLWHIINRCESGAISWGSTGCTVILDYKKFQDEYLSNEEKIFKTNNMTSFIRQLNMYGFRKVATHKSEVLNFNNPNIHEFVHESFQCGRVDLLDRVVRKTGTRNSKSVEPIFDDEIRVKIMMDDFYKDFDLPLTRLQTCQVALREELHKATIQFEARQTRQFLEDSEDFDYEEFKFYSVDSDDLLKHELEVVTLYVPKMTDTDNREWYSEALINYIPTHS